MAIRLSYIVQTTEAVTRPRGSDPNYPWDSGFRVSATQISTWEECERKWGWKYIAKIPSPPSASAALGSETHAQLERYLTTGEAFDFTKASGEIAAAGLEHLPAPMTPGMEVEVEFAFKSPRTGITYMGFKDVELAPDATPDGVPCVIDHKTTSNIKLWAKTSEDLRTNVQAQLYAADTLRKLPDVTPETPVDLKWIYYQTKGARKAKVTHLRLLAREVAEQFDRIDAVAEILRTNLDQVTDPLQLRPNLGACSSYGGCPYQGNCNFSPQERLKSLMAGPTANPSSLLDRLKANNAPSMPPAAAMPAPPAAVNPPEFQRAPTVAELEAGNAPAGTPAPHAAASVAHPHGLGSLAPAGTPAASPGASLFAAAFGAKAPEVPPAAVAVPPPVEAPAPAKRGPGRPRKNPAPAVPATEPALTSEEADDDMDTPVPYVPTKTIRVLYVNCAPNRTTLHADDFISEAKKVIRDSKGLEDYRFAEYGQGPGMLSVATAAAVDADISELGFINELVIDSTTPEGSAVLLELVARAATVVR